MTKNVTKYHRRRAMGKNNLKYEKKLFLTFLGFAQKKEMMHFAT